MSKKYSIFSTTLLVNTKTTNRRHMITIQEKEQIINQLCYTALVYGRINKKLKTNLSKTQIEELFAQLINEVELSNIERKGKNYYISHFDQSIRITVNSYTFRVITADIIVCK